ncbi:glycosyltransferase [Candidatus Binatia bacterium]|nr:glycosyltransferase [Candidatus Binatia bacterium]
MPSHAADPPALSVIVCTHDRCAMLARLLGALIRQRAPRELRWEIVVVDNGSHDATRAVVARIAASAPVPIRYVFEPRVGLCVARNRGVRESAAPLLAFTDDDVVPEPDWLAELLAAVDAVPCEVVGGRIDVASPAPLPAWLEGDLLGCVGRLDLGDEPVAFDGRQTYPFGANMLFRREPLQRASGFDEHVGRVGSGRRWWQVVKGEEQLLVTRILGAGGRAMYAPRARVAHCIEHDHLGRGHFRRLYFAAGYRETLLARAAGVAAPRTSGLECAQALFWFAKQRVQRGGDASFRRQLGAIYLLGRLAGCVRPG